MQLRSALTTADIQDAARLARPRFFWLRFLAASWYSTALCVAVLYSIGNALAQHHPINWNDAGLMLGLAALFYGIRWSRWRSRLGRAAAPRNRAASISIDPDGIRTKQESGATSFAPWASFSKWTEGRSVFVLSGKEGSMILPVDDGNRDSVRALLQGNIAGSGRPLARV